MDKNRPRLLSIKSIGLFVDALPMVLKKVDATPVVTSFRTYNCKISNVDFLVKCRYIVKNKLISSILLVSDLALNFPTEGKRMKLSQRLIENRIAIKQVLSKYGASNVHIWGLEESASESEPDVYVLISFDKEDKRKCPVIVCFQSKFLERLQGRVPWDKSGYNLIESMKALLGRGVTTCGEEGLKKYHPLTYSKTLAVDKWHS